MENLVFSLFYIFFIAGGAFCNVYTVVRAGLVLFQFDSFIVRCNDISEFQPQNFFLCRLRLSQSEQWSHIVLSILRFIDDY